MTVIKRRVGRDEEGGGVNQCEFKDGQAGCGKAEGGIRAPPGLFRDNAPVRGCYELACDESVPRSFAGI